MTDTELKAYLNFLSKYHKPEGNSILDYEEKSKKKIIKKIDPNTFSISDEKLLSRIYDEWRGDGMELVINFNDKTLNCSYWTTAKRNNVAFKKDVKSIPLKWEALERLDKQFNTMFEKTLEEVSFRKMVNEYKSVLKDKILETGGEV